MTTLVDQIAPTGEARTFTVKRADMTHLVAGTAIELCSKQCEYELREWCEKNGKKIARFVYSGHWTTHVEGGDENTYRGMVTAVFEK